MFEASTLVNFVTPSMRPTAVLTAALAVAVGAWITRRVMRARRKSPEELERIRRLDVNQRGRLATGQVRRWGKS